MGDTHPFMNPAFGRLLALVSVFLIAFVSVSSMRTCRAGGDLRSLVPWLKEDDGRFRPEEGKLAERAPLDFGDVEVLSRLNDEYAKLTEAVVPSVVSIDTAGVKTERLFDVWGRTQVRRYPTQGQGSGVIVTEQGHVVTNHHVIAGQQQIHVTLHDGEVYPATLVGEDTMLDIAVLRIEAKREFTPLKLGDSSKAQVGQMVFAVGNPFGLGETITQGIISAKERSLSDNQRDLFQTDAAINPGNSGGPLVNLLGEIIGINVAIFSQDKENPGFQGVGFSIPANDVRDSLLQILKRGRPIRGFLGLQMRDLDMVVRSALKYDGEYGTAVLAVTPNSPAEKAGLRKFDVVLSYAGVKIKSYVELRRLVEETGVGESVAMEVWRGGETLTLNALITEAGSVSSEATGAESTGGKTRDAGEVLESLGIEVRDLSTLERAQGYSGVVVTGVARGALAVDRVMAGDLIQAVNHSEVRTAREFLRHLAVSAAVQETTLQLVRGGSAVRVTLPALPRRN